MRQLRHGYTNQTRLLPSGIVEKHYNGPDAADRRQREHLCITHLADRFPVPRVLEQDPTRHALILREERGTHGQDLIESERAQEVLRLLGSLWARLQAIEVSAVPGLPGSGPVIVHGDFGPQNVLIANGHVTALLDWEFAHLGRPIEDLAWAEWIVRMHHPTRRGELPALFAAAQFEPKWTDRQAAMVERCAALLHHAETADRTDGVNLWRTRLHATEAWSE